MKQLFVVVAESVISLMMMLIAFRGIMPTGEEGLGRSAIGWTLCWAGALIYGDSFQRFQKIMEGSK